MTHSLPLLSPSSHFFFLLLFAHIRQAGLRRPCAITSLDGKLGRTSFTNWG